MQQERFVQAHRPEWAQLRELLGRLEGRGAGPVQQLPAACRRVSQHLSLARTRGYSADLVEELHELAMRSHQQLYRPRLDPLGGLVALLRTGLPQAVRREWRLVLLAHLGFYGAFALTWGIVHTWPHQVFSVLDPTVVSGIEEMYDPHSEHFLRERSSDSDLLMFGFYIWNNIGIGFRTFASGALLGLGPLVFLSFNGVMLGATFAHLANVGMGSTLYPFAISHGAFELTALVLTGAAGSRLGLALVMPGRYPRSEALRRAALRALPILQGAGAMLVVAAALEAFWDPSTWVPVSVKVGGGALLWGLVYAWLLLGGRRAPRALGGPPAPR